MITDVPYGRHPVPHADAVSRASGRSLLVPAAMALGGGRGGKESMSLASLLIPQAPIFRFVYTPYGMGLTTIAITMLITSLTYRKTSERVLSYGCALCLPYQCSRIC